MFCSDNDDDTLKYCMLALVFERMSFIFISTAAIIRANQFNNSSSNFLLFLKNKNNKLEIDIYGYGNNCLSWDFVALEVVEI